MTRRQREIRNAIIDWIREDAPMAAKMSISPIHVYQLVARILPDRTTAGPDVQGEPFSEEGMQT